MNIDWNVVTAIFTALAAIAAAVSAWLSYLGSRSMVAAWEEGSDDRRLKLIQTVRDAADELRKSVDAVEWYLTVPEEDDILKRKFQGWVSEANGLTEIHSLELDKDHILRQHLRKLRERTLAVRQANAQRELRRIVADN